jgi:hypothetical protein
MPSYSVQVIIMPATMVQADAAVNTWSCEAISDAEAQNFAGALQTFYQSCRPLFSSLVAQNGHRIKIYDRSDPPPRVPRRDFTFNFTAAMTASPLPTEVSKCLSFQGVPESGVSQARKRGRIYLGPLGGAWVTTQGRAAGANITTMVNAADVLLAASDASANWTWTVYSATTGDSFPVSNGWVDDEFDTQRRRGRPATTRTTFS